MKKCDESHIGHIIIFILEQDSRINATGGNSMSENLALAAIAAELAEETREQKTAYDQYGIDATALHGALDVQVQKTTDAHGLLTAAHELIETIASLATSSHSSSEDLQGHTARGAEATTDILSRARRHLSGAGSDSAQEALTHLGTTNQMATEVKGHASETHALTSDFDRLIPHIADAVGKALEAAGQLLTITEEARGVSTSVNNDIPDVMEHAGKAAESLDEYAASLS